MPDAERLETDGPVLRLSGAWQLPDTAISAHAVDALWYDVNPYGPLHANCWRVVWTEADGLRFLTVYDQAHLREPFRRWLAANFPPTVVHEFDVRYGSPGGDDPSVCIWRRSAACPEAQGAP